MRRPGAGWWRHRSLRARLTLAAAVGIASAVTLSAVLLTLRLQAGLTGAADEVALDRAEAVVAALLDGRLPETLRGEDDDEVLVQVVDPLGRVLATSPGVPRDRPVFEPPVSSRPRLRTVEAVGVADADGPYRVVTVPVDVGRQTLVVHVAASVEEAAESVTELRAALALGVPVVVAVLTATTWFLVGRALRPVEALRREAAAIPGTELARRLPVPPGGDELARLATTFNALLARADAAQQRQREFLADAAHEIRSPLAAVRAHLEVAQRHPDPERWHEQLDVLVADTARLSRLVDDLLRLARLDAQRAVDRQPVDLDDLVLAAARRPGLRAEVALDVTGVAPVQVEGDPVALAGVVQNLLDNAVRHASRRVSVVSGRQGEDAVLVVADDGPGIPVADRERVFERFTRLDEARSRDEGGAGLGLAIVRGVVAAHGGRVHVEDAGPGARFVVRLPVDGGVGAAAGGAPPAAQ